MKNLTFTKDDWMTEVSDSKGKCRHSKFGSCNIPCPNCFYVGFYHWRKARDRKYRACKFCGFWQEAGGEPYFCKMIYCTTCRVFDWWKPDEMRQGCSNCDQKVGEKKMFDVPPPTKDPAHPFWGYKNEIEKKHLKAQDIFRQADIAALKWITFFIIWGGLLTYFIYR